MGLESGLYLTSNVCHGPGQPIYSAYVSQKENRQKQWADIKEARVDQGLCNIYLSEADWKTATAEFVRFLGEQGKLRVNPVLHSGNFTHGTN
jgi:hypothetical protein